MLFFFQTQRFGIFLIYPKTLSKIVANDFMFFFFVFCFLLGGGGWGCWGGVVVFFFFVFRKISLDISCESIYMKYQVLFSLKNKIKKKNSRWHCYSFASHFNPCHAE